MITVVSKHLSRELIPRLTPLTRSLTFLNVLEIDEDGIEYFNPQVLKFPNLKSLALGACSCINNAKFDLPKVEDISFQCVRDDISILTNFNFDGYYCLKDLNLFFETKLKDNFNIGNISFGNCTKLILELGAVFPTTGTLRDLVLPNVEHLEALNFCSFININAPKLKLLNVSLDEESSTDFISFKNFNAPSLLQITSGRMLGREWGLKIEKFEDVHVPKLQEIVGLNEEAFFGPFFFQSLKVIRTQKFYLWLGRFDPLKLKQLFIDTSDLQTISNNYSALYQYTGLPSLKELSLQLSPGLDFFSLRFLRNIQI